MATPKETVWTLEPHTQAKHAILRRYLDAWFPIMSSISSRLVFFDGFAGPGVYAEGEPGSPRIALDSLLEHTHLDKMRHREFAFLFNEQDPGRHASLVAVIEELRESGTVPLNVTIHVVNDTFSETVDAIEDALKTAGAQMAPTFAFLDPFGYKGLSMQSLSKLLSYEKAEVLVYLDINSLVRFSNAGNVDQHFSALMGSDAFRDAPVSGDERREFLRDLYEDQLKRHCGFKYTRSFLMRGEANRPICYLVYATRNIAGLKAMKESMWKVSPSGDYSFSDDHVRNPLLFAETFEPDRLADDLHEAFGGRSATIEQVSNYVVIATPYLATHVKRSLKLLEADGRISAESAPGRVRKRGTYPDGTVITFMALP